MQKSDSIASISAALAKAQHDVENASKNAKTLISSLSMLIWPSY